MRDRKHKSEKNADSWIGWMHDADLVSGDLPDLMVEASRVAHTVAQGLHGRRRAGPGEGFWQFRRFQAGDPASRVDWRRSARDDHIYIREQEWESAHTIWIWPDRSPAMAFRSDLAQSSKARCAIILGLALAELFVRGGERVGIPGLTRPALVANTPRRMAEALARQKPDDLLVSPGLPPANEVRAFSDYVIISDFLGDTQRIEERISAIAGAGVRCHLVQILDPAEETFPFEGRLEFVAPDGGKSMVAGRAEALREEYQQKLAILRARLGGLASRIEGTFLCHRTDRSMHHTLLALHGVLSADNFAGAISSAGGGKRKAEIRPPGQSPTGLEPNT
ncbi:MAG: DUF58 domain-containing protein [Alphaproteobacteria bacterium]